MEAAKEQVAVEEGVEEVRAGAEDVEEAEEAEMIVEVRDAKLAAFNDRGGTGPTVRPHILR